MKITRHQLETYLSGVLVVGNVIILMVAIRVEILSDKSGVSLPYTDKGNYSQKWRVASDRACVIELKRQITMRRMEAHRLEYPEASCPTEEEVMATPLTDEELMFFYSERRKNIAELSLVNWLSTMGLLQYILAPTMLVLSIYAVFFSQLRHVRITGVLTLCVSVACCAAMFYRGYFTSLGMYD